MICIISGPSCAGKSTLINSYKISDVTHLSPSIPTLFPDSTPWYQDALKGDCNFHYNILRYADYLYRNPGKTSESYLQFMSDLPWAEILASPTAKKAIVLLASRTVLLSRILSRKHVELTALTGNPNCQYPNRHWMDLLKRIDIHELYLAWCSELDNNGIPYTLIDSSNKHYSTIKPDQVKSLRLNQ